jgi:D-amino peptidase
MKIYISLDMEGIAGTFSWKQEENNRAEVRKNMMHQVQWVIEGIHSSKVNKEIKEIVIADSHSGGDSLLYDITALDDRLHLISGYPRPQYMMPAFDKSYSIVFFVGYHGGIGSLHSVMDHSYSPRFHRIWINDKPMNESLINAAYAGAFKVPVGLVIGDDALGKQLLQPEGLPWVNYVTTKYSLSRFAVKNKPLNIVKKETHDAVVRTLEKDISSYPLYTFKKPFRLQIECQTASLADYACMMPEVKRLDGVTIELVNDNYEKVFNAIDGIATLTNASKW